MNFWWTSMNVYELFEAHQMFISHVHNLISKFFFQFISEREDPCNPRLSGGPHPPFSADGQTQSQDGHEQLHFYVCLLVDCCHWGIGPSWDSSDQQSLQTHNLHDRSYRFHCHDHHKCLCNSHFMQLLNPISQEWGEIGSQVWPHLSLLHWRCGYILRWVAHVGRSFSDHWDRHRASYTWLFLHVDCERHDICVSYYYNPCPSEIREELHEIY